MGKPIIPARTKIHALIQEGVTDVDVLVAGVGTDAAWVRDITEDELRLDRIRRMPGIYCPVAVAYINSVGSDFMVGG